MSKKLVKAAKFDAKKMGKAVSESINEMMLEIANIEKTIDEAEEATIYVVDRLSIDKALSRIGRDLENLESYCEKFFWNYKQL